MPAPRQASIAATRPTRTRRLQRSRLSTGRNSSRALAMAPISMAARRMTTTSAGPACIPARRSPIAHRRTLTAAASMDTAPRSRGARSSTPAPTATAAVQPRRRTATTEAATPRGAAPGAAAGRLPKKPTPLEEVAIPSAVVVDIRSVAEATQAEAVTPAAVIPAADIITKP
jgi:hypothetical protein